MIEIEIKAKLTELQYLNVKTYLDTNFTYNGSVGETDLYFNGIDRDFAKTDEAFRIRKEVKNDITTVYITYKGSKLSKNIKARQELEVAVADYDTMLKITKALGFKEVATVEKQRHYYKSGDITATLDNVTRLGYFIELEMLALETDDLTKYSDLLFSLLDKLGIEKSAATNTSYLEMLLNIQE